MRGKRWPHDHLFTPLTLEPLHRECPFCGGFSQICAHREHPIDTLSGSLKLICKLTHCGDSSCPGFHKTRSPEEEYLLTWPHWTIGWDVFAFIGHRRFHRHWSVPQLRAELADCYDVHLSADLVERTIHQYAAMVAAWHQDLANLKHHYRGIEALILSIDGLQPEKGHETLYVVRELNGKRCWFAQTLLSSAQSEVDALFIRTREMVEAIGLPVAAWLSDKQDTFVKAIPELYPGVPHIFCRNHFMREAATEMLRVDAQVKSTLRKKVRGLRTIERDVLENRRAHSEVNKPESEGSPVSLSKIPRTPVASNQTSAASGALASQDDAADQVVLDYCAAVRGVLNSDQGSPLMPSGLRMSEALLDVRASLMACTGLKKGGPSNGNSAS